MTSVMDVPMYSDSELRAACAKAAAAERERLLAALREFLPRYVATVIQHGLDGQPIYTSGPIAFPDALVHTFALMDTPDADLLGAATEGTPQ